MATMEQTAGETFGKIPLGRRIAELMQERGDAFSIRAFSDRLDMNRETLRLTLIGERPISISLLEKIAKGLHVTEERLRQLDTVKKQEELERFFKASNRTKIMMMRAHSVAAELAEVALGATERGYSLNNLGRVQYLLKQYDEAHQTWLYALEYAKKNQEMYKDSHLLKIVSANLMLTYTVRREYSNIDDLLQMVEDYFPDNPQALGMVYYTRMRVQKERGNLERARKYAYCSLEHYQRANDKDDIGRALVNVAYCEYLLGEYKTSSEALQSAMKYAKDYENTLILVVKEYVKTQMKLGDYETAIQLVEQYEPLANEYPDFRAKWQILYTVLRDDPTYAERICLDSNVDMSIRYAACQCLFEYFAKKGDSEAALEYHRKGRIYSNDKSSFYDKRGF